MVGPVVAQTPGVGQILEGWPTEHSVEDRLTSHFPRKLVSLATEDRVHTSLAKSTPLTSDRLEGSKGHLGLGCQVIFNLVGLLDALAFPP